MTGGRKTKVNFNVECYNGTTNYGLRMIVVKLGGRKTQVPYTLHTHTCTCS